MLPVRSLRPASAAAIAVALTMSVAACGSSSDATTSSSGDTGRASTPAAAVAYDGPESKLDAAYPEPEVKSGFSFTVGWLSPNTANNFVKAIADAGQARTEELGGKFILLSAGNDVNTQVGQCNQLVAQKVDAMAVYAVDPSALGPCLKQAAAEGIKIIGQDTPPIAGDDLLPNYLSSVSQGPDRAAYALAAAAAEAHPGGTFATLGVAIPVPLLKYFTERETYWAKRLGLSYLGDVDAQADTSQDAATAMNTILTRWSDVDVVFGYNDPSAEAAATTGRAAGKTDIAVYGDDGEKGAVEMVKGGQLAGTVRVDTTGIGTQQINGLYDALTNQNLPLPEQIAPPPTVVTEANADSITPIG